MSSKRLLILGIDPGLSGGIAILNIQTNRLELLEPMPVRNMALEFVASRPGIDARRVIQLISPFKDLIDLVVIEDVHSMPGQGVVSMFNFGYGYGLLCGILASLFSSHQILKTHPAVWKASMNLSASKKLSLERAAELWPEQSKIFKTKSNDGMAEAALLCEFGRKALEN